MSLDAQPPSHAVLEQAAHWYALLRDGRAGQRVDAQWRAWLRADESHRMAWRYIEEIGFDFAPLRGQPDARLAADTLGKARRYQQNRRRLLAGVAMVAAGGLSWLSWREALLPASLLAWGADHRTGVGEQRDITLADGSLLWLNTASAITVQFDDHARTITLVKGEIFIETASDTSRPFLVLSRDGRMQALGTRFTVQRHDTQTSLAVYDGAVEIRTATNSTTHIVQAGQQTRFSATRVATIETADVAREAWIRGALVADNLPLRDVVHELRRYRRGHLGLADEVANLTVYGNFPVQDPDRVLRMLASALPIRISQPLPWWTSIEARR